MEIKDYNKINYDEDTITVIKAKNEALEKAEKEAKKEEEKKDDE